MIIFPKNRSNYFPENKKRCFFVAKKNRSNEEQRRNQPKADAEFSQEVDANKKENRRK